MLIKDVMSVPVVTIEPSKSAYDAARLMLEKNIRRLPVVRSGCLVGIATDRDIREAKPSILTRLPAEASDEILRATLVEVVMTKKVVTVNADDPMEQAALLMIRYKIGGIPVMDKEKLVGILTETDAFRLLATFLGAEPGYFQVVLLDTPQSRRGVQEAFKRFETQVRSILFSPKYPEIVMVFKAPRGEQDSEEISKALRAFSFQILDSHLFEPGSAPAGVGI